MAAALVPFAIPPPRKTTDAAHAKMGLASLPLVRRNAAATRVPSTNMQVKSLSLLQARPQTWRVAALSPLVAHRSAPTASTRIARSARMRLKRFTATGFR